MATIWLSSDQHLGHANILTFKGSDGQLIRPQFQTVEEMNDYIITQHNAVVKPNDHWYCVGDIVMNKNWLWLVKRMNGEKRIVLGNHDPDVKALVAAGFEKMFGSRRLDNVILTHYPLHISSIGDGGHVLGNVHGHIHQNPSPEGPYLNVSVEALQDYTPITLEDARAKLQAKRDAAQAAFDAARKQAEEASANLLARCLNMDKMAKYEGV